MNSKPDLFELESLRSELIEKTLETTSNNLRLSLYQSYFEKVLSLDNANYNEAFLNEFIDDYLNSIQMFEIFGTNPKFTDNLLQQLKKLITLSLIKEKHSELISETERIEKQKQKLAFILEGKEYQDIIERKAFFPLIDDEAPSDFYGTLESITVRINKSVDADKFIIVPSEKEIEKRISEQCRRSWLLAFSLSKKYIKKPFKYHEVIISFDKKQGFYEGNSLGIALTLSFLERMLKFYNTAYIINLKERSAFTGGVTEAGEVLCTSEEIIKRKVAAVFFSEIDTFVFPKCEETYAYFALTQLKKSYPNRKLKLIPVEDIKDVINRRDVVDIKRQKVVVRTGKFIKKNWISAVATVLLAILFAYLFVMDFDDNPSSLTTDGNLLYVKNKNGRVLWEKVIIPLNPKIIEQNYLNCLTRIIDINNDGLNEVLITNQIINNKTTDDTLRCYSAKGEIIWKYAFNDEIFAKREKLSPEYGISIIDTLTFKEHKSLFLFSSNGPSFSSAIYRIDLKTGLKLSGVFWASGHITGGLVRDIDNDGNPEMIGLGFDNGYEDVVLFVYEIDTTNKVRPSTEDYLIRNYPISKMKAYIRFPKTDYDNYYNQRTPKLDYEIPLFTNNQNAYRFNFNNFHDDRSSSIQFHISSDFKEVTPFIESRFRVLRDTLVAHNILNLPYTDTEEYKNIIKNSILYWESGKWVKREDLDK
ncbi:MAG TPA: hypothetical protein PKD67_12170 [Ignavibacteriaceae bacterium]|nr:hypothetical protein [Ignavibacteriaceae bacterium]